MELVNKTNMEFWFPNYSHYSQKESSKFGCVNDLDITDLVRVLSDGGERISGKNSTISYFVPGGVKWVMGSEHSMPLNFIMESYKMTVVRYELVYEGARSKIKLSDYQSPESSHTHTELMVMGPQQYPDNPVSGIVCDILCSGEESYQRVGVIKDCLEEYLSGKLEEKTNQENLSRPPYSRIPFDV